MGKPVNRDAAIEAGARSFFGESQSDPSYSAEWNDLIGCAQDYWRKMAAAVIDAAASHLAPEPVGYALIAGKATAVRFPDVESAHAARKEWLVPSATVVALVPVEGTAVNRDAATRPERTEAAAPYVAARALREAADDIQALHPGEVKASVLWLRDRADLIERGQP